MNIDQKRELLYLLEEKERLRKEQTIGREVTAGMGSSTAPELGKQEAALSSMEAQKADMWQNPAQLFRPREAAPYLGAAAGSLAMPATIPMQMLGGAGGFLAGKGVENLFSGEEMGKEELMEAGQEGLVSGGGAVAAKGFGKVADWLLGTGGTEKEATRAIAGARREGLPLPPWAVRNTPMGETLDSFASLILGGHIPAKGKARVAEEYIESGIEGMRKSGVRQPIEVSAKRGQQWVDKTLKEAHARGSNAFDDFIGIVGEDTKVNASGLVDSMRRQFDTWDRQGISAAYSDTPDYKRLRAFMENYDGSTEFYTLESVRRAAQNLSEKAKADKLVWKGADNIAEGVTKQYETIGAGIGRPDILESFNKGRELVRQSADLSKVKGAKELAKEGKRSYAWLNDMATNPTLLNMMRKDNPELFAQVADSWMDNAMFRIRGRNPRMEGGQLRTWFDTNKQTIRQLYGGEATQAFDNLTRYAKFMNDEIKRQGGKIEAIPAAASIASAFGTGKGSAFIEIPAFVLSSAMRDPNSSFFKLFAQPLPKIVNDLGFRGVVITSQNANQ